MPLINQISFDKTKQIYVPRGTNFLDWCVANYPPCFDYDNLRTEIKIGESLIEVDDISENELVSILNFELDNDTEVSISQFMRGGDLNDFVEAPFRITGAAIGAVGSLLGSLVPTPRIPNLQGEIKQSPNSNLKAARNSFRKGQAVSDKAGETYATPDFAQRSYFEYVGNRKTVNELFIVGAGRYDKAYLESQTSNGETLISNISGATATAYDLVDGDTVPANLQKTVIGSNNIDGQELEPEDSDLFVQSIDNVTFFSTTELRFVNTETLVQDFDLQVGDNVELSGTNAGTFEVSSITDTGGNIEIEFTGVTFSLVTETVTFTKQPPTGETVNNWTDWFDLSGDNLDDVWFHIQMPQGCQKEGGKRLTMQIQFEIDDTGTQTPPFKTFTQSISELTQQPQFRTFKASDNAITLTTNSVRVRARRITTADDAGDNASDSVALEEAVSVKLQSGNNYGNTMMLSVVRRANNLALGGSENKINTICRRMLRLFNTGTGMQEATYTHSRQAADYIFYLLYDLGGYSLDAIDTTALFAIRDGLSDPQLGYFDYAFDDKDISLEDRVKTAADAMRCLAFKNAGVWNFVREEAQQVRQALISARIMTGEYTISYGFSRAGDFDGIKLEYVDPTLNEKAFINRRINTSTGAIEVGVGTNVKNIDFSYCRNATQATNRADFEIRKIAYVNRRLSVDVYKDAAYFEKGMRVDFADPEDSLVYAGEILSGDGTTFVTSERFLPVGGETYFCQITNDEGLPTSALFEVTANPTTEFGFVVASSQSYYLATNKQQLNSRYKICTTATNDLSDYIVEDVQNKGDNVYTVKLVEYNSKLYEAD